MTLTTPTIITDVQYAELLERLKGMRRKETCTHYRIPDYLAAEWQNRLVEEAAEDDIVRAVNELSNPDDIDASSDQTSFNQTNELWREKICEWFYEVVDHWDYSREVVNVAMSYLDRYLAHRTVNRRIFQLAAMTALYLAIKLYVPETFHISTLVELSRGYFLAEHIVKMEASMLKALSWHIHPPISFAFCRDMIKLVSADVTPRLRHDLSESAKFLTELSVSNYYFVTRKPSSIAVAAIVNAFELMGPEKIEPKYKVGFLRNIAYADIGLDIDDDGDEIIECYERLREIYIAGDYTSTSDDEDDLPPATTSSTNKRKSDGNDTIRSTKKQK